MQQAFVHQGLHVRFSMAQAEPEISGLELAKDFALGKATPNPAFSYIVGSMGIWQDGELESEVPGRFLKFAGDSLQPPAFIIRDLTWRGRAQDATWPAMQEFTAPVYYPGNGVAVLRTQPDGSQAVTVDLCNLLSLDSYRNNANRPTAQGFAYPVMHADLGALELVVTAGNQTASLGVIPYGGGDTAATNAALAQGLVFDLPVTPQQAQLVASGSWRSGSRRRSRRRRPCPRRRNR